MSKALMCDNCGTAIPTNDRGENPDGEEAAWLSISTCAFGTSWHACTRSCAVALIDDGPVRDAVESELNTIAEIARAVKADEAGDPS